MRGARSVGFSKCCVKLQGAVFDRTSLEVLDLSALFIHPTGPHLAPFILPSLGRRSPPRRSCAALRQTAIEQRTRPTPRPQIARKFVAIDMLNLWWHYVRHVSPDRAEPERRSCGGPCLLFAERSQESGKQTGVGLTW